jgi:hypothetical protein
MKTKMMMAASLALMMASGAAYAQQPTAINGDVAHHAGMCRDEINRYNKEIAEDNAADKSEWAPAGTDKFGSYPSAEETNDSLNRKQRANIIEGCKPGGVYDQLDEALRQVKAICAAHPDKKGC